MSSGHYQTDVSVVSDKVHYSLCLGTSTLGFISTTLPLSLINLHISILAYYMNFAVILYFLNVEIPQGSSINPHFS